VLIECAGQLRDAEVQIEKVMQSRQEAEQQISASKVKMDVLSNYFKDKEKELTRSVGSRSSHPTYSIVVVFCLLPILIFCSPFSAFV